VNSTVIGGAMLPHAPQFFTMPDTEDRETVGRVKATAAEIGTSLKAMTPDLWIIISNDHAEQFFHLAAPPFTVHVGNEANGTFAGRDFHWRVPSEVGFELVRQMYRQGFDPAFTSAAEIDYAIGIPLTHLGITDPVLPIYVNAYLPPQPTMERCYAFGQAIARVVTAMGLRTAVVASGGMSHFPGTERYAHPELAWDNAVLEKLATGNLKSLIGWDEAALDQSGNVELRCWAVAAGALGERKPDIVELTTALHGLAHDEEMRREYLTNVVAYADRFRLTAPQRAALLALDTPAIVAMGAHPLVPFLARMQIERQRRD